MSTIRPAGPLAAAPPPRAVNNELYRRLGHAWWDESVGEFATIRFFVNPVRFGCVGGSASKSWAGGWASTRATT
jgi:hypothetical protein